MKKIITNKKFLIIAAILALGIVVPQFASADFFENAGNAIMQALGKLLTRLLTWVVDWSAEFFEAMLKKGFEGHQNIAKIGWDVTRDFANMLFILFMVVIAFATILRFERYGVKELLPKIIMIALLINFSMVICYVIIDFTNIVAHFFINDAKKGIPGQELTISAILADSFKLPDLFIPMVCEKYLDQRDECYNMDIKEQAINNCVAAAENNLNQCYAQTEKEQTEENDFWDVMVAIIGSAAILTIAAFVLIAGGILLIVRLVTIWFLVMIAPLAFICYVLPALRKNWEAWWSQFIRWCIFAPAYSFFIWLACKISLENKLDNIAVLDASISLRGPEAINAFFSSTGNILHFLFLCGLLVGGLLAANQLGIRGANTAMVLGKRWAGTAKGWAKKQAMKPVKGVAERAGAGAGMLRGGAMATIGKMFGGKIGGRMAARGAQIKQSAAERAYNKKYASVVGMMSKEDTLKEVETAMGSRKLIAIRSAQNRGFMREATTEQTATAINALARFGDVDSSRKLAEIRPDAVTGNERKEAIERAITNGTHKQWGKQVFDKNKFGKEIMREMNKQLSPQEFASVFRTWTKEVREAGFDSLQANFDDTSWDKTKDENGKDVDSNNVAARKAYYRVTNDAQKAFYQDENSNNLNEELTEIGGRAHLVAKSAIIKTNAENMDRVTPDPSLKYAARDITIGQIPTLGYGMQNDESKGKLKKFVADEIDETRVKMTALIDQESKESEPKKLAEIRQKIVGLDTHLIDRQKVKKAMDESEYWGGKKPEKTPPSPGAGTPPPSKTAEEIRKEEQEKRRKEYEDYENKM